MNTFLKKIEATREQIGKLENLLRDPANAHESRTELKTTLATQIADWHEQAIDREGVQRWALQNSSARNRQK